MLTMSRQLLDVVFFAYTKHLRNKIPTYAFTTLGIMSTANDTLLLSCSREWERWIFLENLELQNIKNYQIRKKTTPQFMYDSVEYLQIKKLTTA